MSTNIPKITIDNLFDLERLDETLGKYVELDLPIELEFSEIELSEEHINKLKEVLQKNSKVNIKTIKFSNTGISAEGLKIISEIMDEKPNLQVITENFHFNREVMKRPPLFHLVRHLDISSELKSVEDLYKEYSKKVIERRELQLEAVKNDLESYLDALFENEKISEEDIAKIDEFIEDPSKFIDSEGKLSSEIGTILFNKVKIEGLINKLFKFRDQWKSMNELQGQLKNLQKNDALDALTSLVDVEFNFQLAKRDLSYDEVKAKKENKGRMDALELLHKEKEEPKIGKIFEEMNRKELEWNEEWLKIENESAKRALTLTSPAEETEPEQNYEFVPISATASVNAEAEIPLRKPRIATNVGISLKDLKEIIKNESKGCYVEAIGGKYVIRQNEITPDGDIVPQNLAVIEMEPRRFPASLFFGPNKVKSIIENGRFDVLTETFNSLPIRVKIEEIQVEQRPRRTDKDVESPSSQTLQTLESELSGSRNTGVSEKAEEMLPQRSETAKKTVPMKAGLPSRVSKDKDIASSTPDDKKGTKKNL